ncbi:hypothetical protein DL764_005233 [Monosporascus ibericus]|uniref:Uncharacterized protein n=1 Tax=Monosporascus ibericus TaxID=155417 RepID=A0A4Q4TD92_9PEZI|nr:hypothetical protein DL764_005233 [Monosporascus ibericus]
MPCWVRQPGKSTPDYRDRWPTCQTLVAPAAEDDVPIRVKALEAISRALGWLNLVTEHLQKDINEHIWALEAKRLECLSATSLQTSPRRGVFGTPKPGKSTNPYDTGVPPMATSETVPHGRQRAPKDPNLKDKQKVTVLPSVNTGPSVPDSPVVSFLAALRRHSTSPHETITPLDINADSGARTSTPGSTRVSQERRASGASSGRQQKARLDSRYKRPSPPERGATVASTSAASEGG